MSILIVAHKLLRFAVQESKLKNMFFNSTACDYLRDQKCQIRHSGIEWLRGISKNCTSAIKVRTVASSNQSLIRSCLSFVYLLSPVLSPFVAESVEGLKQRFLKKLFMVTIFPTTGKLFALPESHPVS
jgi:hypothetical protein